MVRSSGLRKGSRNFEKINLVALPARELNFDKLKSGELHEKHSTNWHSQLPLVGPHGKHRFHNSPIGACAAVAVIK
jgi:hypothetical protein